ncbi:MAG: hypothetical protein AAFP89_03820 [Bacteroidota bacterium]
MAKKFLDVLGDAFEDDMLEDVIPSSQRKRTKKKETPRRNKRFLDDIDKSLTTAEKPKSTKKSKGKSLLDSMDEALDNHVFDAVFPDAQTYKNRANRQKQLETRFSTMITTEVLEKAREIALSKGIRIKDVINKALSFYLDNHDA